MDDAGQVLKFVRFGGIATAFIVLLATWFLMRLFARFTSGLGDRFQHRRLALNQGATFIRFLAYIIAVTACIPIIFQLTDQMLLALSGTIAVTLGFAFKDLAASVIAGVTILVDKPFQVGDRINFSGVYGEVAAIGLRSVRLVTLDDNLVTIPNNKFLNELVSSGNAGELNMLVQMDFHIGIDQDFMKAKQIAKEAIISCRYAYLDKPWAVLINEVSLDNYVAIRLRTKVYVMDVRFEKALESDITERLLLALRAARIQPPVHVETNGLAFMSMQTEN